MPPNPQSPAPNPVQLDYSGSFRLVRTIADGGMARVYEAEQLGPAGFAKRIALKVIHPELVDRPGFLRLFTDEAKLSANLLHGNIVQIYQLGRVGGDYFIAMELIRGPSLRELVDRHRELARPIPPTLAAYVGSRVARALDFAHHFVGHDGIALDIVHRDVSPGNVMITWDGHIKLADFGIAKARTMADPGEAGEMVMGKKRYMSPEQLLGLEVEAPSDVFSLACVLYELLSLDPLFTEEGTAQMIRDVAINPLPSLREKVRDLDPELEQILEMALAREAALRPTAAAMGHALDRWLAGQRVFGTPDALESHLAAIFPHAYAPPTRTGE
ncbi:MAG TPA: protein kinase, partial [Gemmatimonadaceae bacterium]|nr:protein kinase [Gemmatimonadaceae bacterium]